MISEELEKSDSENDREGNDKGFDCGKEEIGIIYTYLRDGKKINGERSEYQYYRTTGV